MAKNGGAVGGKMDTANRFLVSGSAGRTAIEIAILRAPKPDERLTAEEAVVLAAWLVAMADPARKLFDEALRQICNA